MKMTIAKKLFFSILGLLVIAVTISIITFNILIDSRQQVVDSLLDLNTNDQISKLAMRLENDNAEMGFRIRGILLNPTDSQEKTLKLQADEDFKETVEKLKQITKDENLLDQIDEVGKMDESGLDQIENKVLDLAPVNKNEAINVYYKEYVPAREKQSKLIYEIVKIATKDVNAVVAVQNSDFSSRLTISYVLLLLVMCSGGVVIFILSKSISQPLEKIKDITQAIADGDLRKTIPDNVIKNDEIGDVAKLINGMTSQLRDMVSQIKKSSLQVASASDEISVSSEQVAKGAETQSSAADQTSSTIVEIASQIDKVARTTQALATNTTEIATTIDQMSSNTKSVANKVKSVDEYSKTAAQYSEVSGQDLVNIINRIEQKSMAVENIIKVIEDIADQTNLLALNASIEAAWAGESGKGFAVVAEAIRNLAERSISATKEISGVVNEVRKETNDATKKVDSIVGQMVGNVQKTSVMLGDVNISTDQQSIGAAQIVKSVEYMNKMTQEVAIATREQQNGSNMIVSAVDNISISSKQNLQAVRQLAKAASDLAGEAETLKSYTELFKI